jgi:hypothetical protein
MKNNARKETPDADHTARELPLDAINSLGQAVDALTAFDDLLTSASDDLVPLHGQTMIALLDPHLVKLREAHEQLSAFIVELGKEQKTAKDHEFRERALELMKS